MFILLFFVFAYNDIKHEQLVVQQEEQKQYCFLNKHLQDAILAASDSTGLDPYLIDAIIVAESGGDVFAKSKTNVRGPMQVTKKTATIYGLNPYDIYENILAGSMYLKDMIEEFKDTSVALVAYNSGPTFVRNNFELITFSYSRRVNRIYESNKEI